MFRKMISMVLALLMVAGTAGAESLFQMPATSQTEAAPSYGVMQGVQPASETTLEDGSTKQIYIGVSGDSFLAYGTLLAQLGYSAGQQETTDGETSVMIMKDDISFRVAYQVQSEILTVTYPAGVAVEQAAVADPFEGYIVIQPGEKIKMFGIAAFVFENTITTEEDMGTSNAGVFAQITNISKTSHIGFYDDNGLPRPVFHFINEDGDYVFEGEYESKSSSGYHWGSLYFHPDPLETETILISAELPQNVLTATEGTLAITFEKEDEKYVLYLQNPGK